MRVVAHNRRARHDYEILDSVEAGMMLLGQEVKSCREGNVHLSGAYVSMVKGRPVLKSATIAPYKFAAGNPDYNPQRDRPLLIKKKEVDKLTATLSEKGLAVIPLEIRAGKHIKVLLGLGRGRKRIDKRHRIREREVERKIRRGEQ
jgi:SsrA-binding protein